MAAKKKKKPASRQADMIDNGAVEIKGPATFGGTATSTLVTPPPGASPAVTEIVNNANQGATSTTPPATSSDPTADSVAAQLAAALKYGNELAGQYIDDSAFQNINAATSPEMQAYLAALKAQMDTAGNYTSLEQEAIDQLRAGLGGYTAPEAQAFREAAQQEINRQYATQRRDLMNQAARFGVRGPAATAQMQDLGVGKLQTQGNLERDLLIKNADEVQRRKEGFANTIRSTEDARFGRQNQTSQNYGTALSGEEQARTGREIFNANQNTNKAVTKSGLALSGAGLWAGQYGSQQAADMAKDQYNRYMDYAKQVQADSVSQYDRYLALQEKNAKKFDKTWGV